MAKNYITPPGFQKLRDEYNQLTTIERPKIVETVAWAASNGDRSENADYIYGKRRLREIDSRIRFLKSRLESAEVVDPRQVRLKSIAFGCTVEIENAEGEIKFYKIVGEDELDPSAGAISWQSPLAKALLGKNQGDEVLLKKPKGEEILVVLSIRYV
jgi:transcription elongation factor GreB